MMNKPFKSKFTVGDFPIGGGQPPYVIAELSGNHKGDKNRALELIKAAKNANADAIKIQTYRPDTITLDHDGPEFALQEGLWKGRTLFDLYQEAHTPWEWHKDMFDLAKDLNIPLFSSPFDNSAVDLLEDLHCPVYKIASFEINDINLIKYAASTGKPLIISTGLATLDEIHEAVTAVADAGGDQLALLHCISGYPTPLEDCNLATITDLKKIFSFPIGLSDHTDCNTAAAVATALGASLIEKHFTLDKSDGSVDAKFSLKPAQFSDMVSSAKKAHITLGRASYDLKPSESGGRAFRRSLYVAKAIKKGQPFTHDNVKSVRPGHGLHTRYLPDIIGEFAACDIEYAAPLKEHHIENHQDIFIRK
jgi:pseudaminic acid synthase